MGCCCPGHGSRQWKKPTVRHGGVVVFARPSETSLPRKSSGKEDLGAKDDDDDDDDDVFIVGDINIDIDIKVNIDIDIILTLILILKRYYK